MDRHKDCSKCPGKMNTLDNHDDCYKHRRCNEKRPCSTCGLWTKEKWKIINKMIAKETRKQDEKYAKRLQQEFYDEDRQVLQDEIFAKQLDEELNCDKPNTRSNGRTSEGVEDVMATPVGTSHLNQSRLGNSPLGQDLRRSKSVGTSINSYTSCSSTFPSETSSKPASRSNIDEREDKQPVLGIQSDALSKFHCSNCGKIGHRRTWPECPQFYSPEETSRRKMNSSSRRRRRARAISAAAGSASQAAAMANEEAGSNSSSSIQPDQTLTIQPQLVAAVTEQVLQALSNQDDKNKRYKGRQRGPHTKKQRTTDTSAEIHEKDIVWLKWRGCPVWPAVVRGMEKRKRKIDKISLSMIEPHPWIPKRLRVKYNQKSIFPYNSKDSDLFLDEGNNLEGEAQERFTKAVDTIENYMTKRILGTLRKEDMEFMDCHEEI